MNGRKSSRRCRAKSFSDAFFNVFGVPCKRVATFEQRVKKLDGRSGYIDLLWKGILLIEQKSRGRTWTALSAGQGLFPRPQDRDAALHSLVFRFCPLPALPGGRKQHEFTLAEFYKTSGCSVLSRAIRRPPQGTGPVNIQTAERMGRLYDKLKEIGYAGHQLEIYLVSCCSACSPKTPAFSGAASFKT